MKRFLFSLMFLSLLTAVSAQEGFKFGFRASPMFSFPNVTDSTKAKVPNLKGNLRMGFSFGLMVSYGFNETVGILTGVHIQRRSLSTEFDPGDVISKNNLTSLEIPVSLKLRSPEIGSGLHIVGLFGMTGEINLTNTKKTSILGGAETVLKDPKYKNIFSSSFQPGAGVDWEFDWGTLFLGANYTWGLMNLLKKSENGNINAKLNTIMVNLGYYF